MLNKKIAYDHLEERKMNNDKLQDNSVTYE